MTLVLVDNNALTYFFKSTEGQVTEFDFAKKCEDNLLNLEKQ